jgi:hypothetical protein
MSEAKENLKERAKKIIDSAVIPEGRETVGKIASDLMQKAPESRDPVEIERAMQENYIAELISCVEINKKKYVGNFYVVVLTKNERLMPNVFRNYFLDRSTCPTPNYDQTVYRYNSEAESIEYIWTVPGRPVCQYLYENRIKVHPSERQLLNFVLDYRDGTLKRLCKKLNKEEEDSNLIKN